MTTDSTRGHLGMLEREECEVWSDDHRAVGWKAHLTAEDDGRDGVAFLPARVEEVRGLAETMASAW